MNTPDTSQASTSQACTSQACTNQAWPDDLFDVLRAAKVRQVAYVPDAGHTRLINRVHADPSLRGIVLTTEEEGVALLAGAWLGGDRGALLMQSSGVGNCVNMLSLVHNLRFPLLIVVTMRGEWAEFNQWQNPMSRVTAQALGMMGLHVMRVDEPRDVAGTMRAAAVQAFDAGGAVAVLLSQRLLGAKVF